MTASRAAIEKTSDVTVASDPFATYCEDDQRHLCYVAALIQHIRNVGTLSAIVQQLLASRAVPTTLIFCLLQSPPNIIQVPKN